MPTEMANIHSKCANNNHVNIGKCKSHLLVQSKVILRRKPTVPDQPHIQNLINPWCEIEIELHVMLMCITYWSLCRVKYLVRGTSIRVASNKSWSWTALLSFVCKQKIIKSSKRGKKKKNPEDQIKVDKYYTNTRK